MANEKLLITILIDNSLAIGEEHLEDFKLRFQNFITDISQNDKDNQILVELLAYKDFNPQVVKKFEEKDFDSNSLEFGKIPFFDRLMCKGLEDLNEEASKQSGNGDIYRPWIVSLVDSKTFDDEFKCIPMLSSMISNKRITYFPFRLKHSISPKFKDLTNLKGFIEIKDYNFEGLFNWLSEMALDRIGKPASENIQLRKDAFTGWTTLL